MRPTARWAPIYARPRTSSIYGIGASHDACQWLPAMRAGLAPLMTIDIMAPVGAGVAAQRFARQHIAMKTRARDVRRSGRIARAAARRIKRYL